MPWLLHSGKHPSGFRFLAGAWSVFTSSRSHPNPSRWVVSGLFSGGEVGWERSESCPQAQPGSGRAGVSPRQLATPHCPQQDALSPAAPPATPAALLRLPSSPGPEFGPRARAQRPGPESSPRVQAQRPGPDSRPRVQSQSPGPESSRRARAHSLGPESSPSVRAQSSVPESRPRGRAQSPVPESGPRVQSQSPGPESRPRVRSQSPGPESGPTV